MDVMDFAILIIALIQIESGGDNKVVGDNGASKGCLQIHQGVINDVNMIYGLKYKHDDAFDRDKAIIICKLYLAHYGKNYEKRTGKKATYEILGRIWNGGPNGYKKGATVAYGDKVTRITRLLEDRKRELKEKDNL